MFVPQGRILSRSGARMAYKMGVHHLRILIWDDLGPLFIQMPLRKPWIIYTPLFWEAPIVSFLILRESQMPLSHEQTGKPKTSSINSARC